MEVEADELEKLALQIRGPKPEDVDQAVWKKMVQQTMQQIQNMRAQTELLPPTEPDPTPAKGKGGQEGKGREQRPMDAASASAAVAAELKAKAEEEKQAETRRRERSRSPPDGETR